MKTDQLVLVILTLLFLVSCSKVSEPQNLNVQFGTPANDTPVDVAVTSGSQIYELSQQIIPEYEEDWDGSLKQVGYTSKIQLQRFGGTGQLIWNREVASVYCSNFSTGEPCYSVIPLSVLVDPQGNINVSYRAPFNDASWVQWDDLLIDTYGPSGEYLGRPVVVDADSYVSGDFAFSSANQLFLATHEISYDANWEDYEDYYRIRAYFPTRALLWQRTSTVGIPYSITVTGAGSVYVIGSQGLARYSSTGNLIWTKTGSSYIGSDLSTLVASGSNLYVSVPKTRTVRKYDADGKLLWSKVQSGLNTLVIGDISADANGNIYISGKYRPTNSSPANAFVRKLRPTGAILWTRTFGTPQYDDARGIATINGSEIYVTGETQGSLAHTNIGGSDGYLRKLNSLGNPVWTR